MPSAKSDRFILLVEDDPADQAIVRRALDDRGFSGQLRVANDGREALDLLMEDGARLPDILLLDINVPRVDGREVISTLRADARFRSLPIIALTTSASERDVREVHELGANSYIVKPTGIDELGRVLDTLQAYWFGTVELPTAQP
ncbi:MAG: response regulator [bacterium]|nr:response regulator [bacterium]